MDDIWTTHRELVLRTPIFTKSKINKSLKPYKQNMNGQVVGINFLDFRLYEGCL